MAAVEVLDGDHHLFGVHTTSMSYVFTVTAEGLLRHLHWGAPIALADVIIDRPIWALSTNDLIHDVMPQEYPPARPLPLQRAVPHGEISDGGRELDLQYQGTTRPIPN